MSSGRWAAGLLLVSAALLTFELLLMRLLALAYWGHFAGMVISIAMLGIACSGLFLFFARTRVKDRAASYFAFSAGLFGVAAPLAFIVSQHLPFTPFLLTWSPREYALLAGRSLLFFLPFFCAGVAIGTPFVARVLPMGRLYFWNMLGSGLPALPLLLAMNFMHPMRLLAAVAALGAAAAICVSKGVTRLMWAAAAACVVAVVAFSSFRYSEYKDLPRTLLLPESKLVEERYGWDGVVQIVDSPHTRYLPGLSLNFMGTLPASKLVFTDAGAMTLAFAPKEALANQEFLRLTPEAFSFSLTTAPRVLHFYGSTAELLRLRVAGSEQSLVVDDNATRVTAVRELLGNAELARMLDRGDARQRLQTANEHWQIIALSLLGTHGTATAGAASLDASFLLTREGCSRLFDHLAADGHASFSTWVENPPRSGVRLVALIADVLRSRTTNPGAHLLAIRSYSTLSIFVGREPFTAEAVEALKRFCDENSFDLVWYNGIDPAETNRFNALPEEPYVTAFTALLGPNREEFIAQSPFSLASPTDDRPFFNHYFRWAAVPEWLQTMGMSWLPFVEWGYLLHVATLVVVTVLGVLLLIVPCILTRARPTLRNATLFFSLGVAYMFVQIWAIYKLSQLVAHPLLAAALVLSAMLCASGAGAVFLTARSDRPRRILGSLCLLLLLAALIFPLLLRAFYPQASWLRAAVGVSWLALPAFFMGFPFPYSLARLAKETDVPWALALNGFGSVIGSLGATLVAVHFGFVALVLSAVALYAVILLLVSQLRVANTP